MTIKSRNRILLIFFAVSLLLLITTLGQFIFAALHSGITPPENTVRTIEAFDNAGPFKYDFKAVIIGIFAFSIYVSSVSIIIYANFEKTQSIEIIYFALFLLGCLTESIRILLAEFDLWQTYSKLLITAGKIIIAGRILTPLSLFFAGTFSETSQRQNVERNIILLIVVSIGLGFLYPLNTLETTSTCAVLWAYPKLFVTVRIFIFLSAIACMFFNAITNNSKEMLRSTIGCILLIIGYLFLISCDCYFNLSFGAALMIAGTFLYLRSVHLIYMWN